DETSKKKPSEFEVTFVSQGIRYQYGFAVTQERIIDEWLLAYPKGRPQRWIERAYNEKSQAYVWGKMEKLSGQKQLWQATTRSNALFLSTAIQLNNQQLKPVFEWFSSTLRVAASIGGWSAGYSIELCENKETRDKIISFLKAADVDIDDIQLEKEKFNKENLPDDIPDEVKKQIEEQFGDKPIVNVKTAHFLTSGKKVLFDLANESDGTRKIFALAGPWIDTLENGYVLVIDELHDNLHPLMVKFLVNLFHCRETNPKNAQLIFTTHDTSILNQEMFRRDQIWFCEKDKDQSSKLYPLTDFSPRKGVENLERGYLAGRYGALPYLENIKLAMGC
ncbi:MAG TPA: ATP-binding protein, partial [Nitrospirae bacterium]|nr:ATP-binding protein [Nitrospirota bacterium]